MPALSSSPTTLTVVDLAPVLDTSPDVPLAPQQILDAFDQLPDPRKPRGTRHRLTGVLAAAAAATIAGATSVAAIAEWTADAGTDVLAHLGIGATVPSLSTFHRILRTVDAHRFDLRVYAWIRLSFTTVDGRTVIACDGKTVRGAVDADGHRPHLLSAYDHTTGASVGQVDVHHKTNEITQLTELLDQFDLTGTVITLDALHTQRGTAEYIVGRGGHFVMCVKRNQPTLHSELKSLPWHEVPVFARETDAGRGRRITRTVKAGMPARCSTPQPDDEDRPPHSPASPSPADHDRYGWSNGPPPQARGTPSRTSHPAHSGPCSRCASDHESTMPAASAVPARTAMSRSHTPPRHSRRPSRSGADVG